MTEEERQRQMDFILEQQAQFTVDMDALRVADERSARRLSRLERVLMLAIRAGQRERTETRERVNTLISAQTHTEEALAQLAESQAHSDRRLDALIDIIKESRNGHGEGGK